MLQKLGFSGALEDRLSDCFAVAVIAKTSNDELEYVI